MASTTQMRARKRELKELNQKAWEGKADIFQVKPPLDSSFKKNTAVIKRLRTSLTPENTTSLLKDIATVSLEKYLSEVIAAVSEGLLKVKVSGELQTAIEVVSALHQRFGKLFTPYIVWNIAKGLSTPGKEFLKGLTPEQREKEESTRLSRQRGLLRVATELWLVNVLRSLDDALNPDDTSKETTLKSGDGKRVQSASPGEHIPLPLEVLKDLLARDRDGTNLTLVVLFLKNYAWDVLGLQARSTSRKVGNEEGSLTEINDVSDNPKDITEDENAPPLTAPNLQTQFKNVITSYFAVVCNHMATEHRRLQQQSKRNAEAYVRSGEVFEDRQQAYEKAVKIQEKLVANAQVVADTLGIDIPKLSADEDDREGDEGMIRESGSMFKKGEEMGPGSMWEDDDQRRFYEDLVDLKSRLPSILLDEGRKGATGGPPEANKDEDKADVEDKRGKKGSDEDAMHEEIEAKLDDLSISSPPDSPKLDAEAMAIPNKTIGAQVDALLIRLPELTNRDLIDSFAFDFCFLNSKASRNRLIKVLQEVPKGRGDLLPYYGRLIATLGKVGFNDVVQGIVGYLDKEFRSLQRRKEKEQLGNIRTQNVRYISELTKFGLVPEHIIFHCLKVALDDFSRTNIDIICNMLEGCGRFLLRNGETQPRMTAFLETLQRKKSAHHLGQQERILIENAFYYVNPPERPAIAAKERSVMELYIRKLVYLDLNKRNYNKIIKSLRKLHWEEPVIFHALVKICSKIWKVRYSNIYLIAILVVGLFRYHQDFGIRVVDGVLEDIRRGLEQNDFRMNQRRVANAKYLGELYNYKMVDSPVIFDTLYLILSFGYDGTPKPGIINPVDTPTDCFRIRLVCTILDTCGICFDRGSSKKKLDFFLAFFQYYIQLKEKMPMDIEFMIQDTFSLVRPSWTLHSSLEEAGKAFEEALAKHYKPPEPGDKNVEADESSSSEDGLDDDNEAVVSDDELDGENDHEQQIATQAETIGNHDESATSSDDDSDDAMDDDTIILTRPEEARDPEADAEFDREFAKIMAESLDSRKFERKAVFDVPLPIKKALAPVQNTYMDEFDDAPVEAPPEKPASTMAFSLLMKKGNKQQTRTVDLPADSSFAISLKSKQEAEREEKQRIKDMVLNYERMEETNELDELKSHAAANGVQFKYGDKNRNSQRGRKLQLSDVTFNWYSSTNVSAMSTATASSLLAPASATPDIIPCNPNLCPANRLAPRHFNHNAVRHDSGRMKQKKQQADKENDEANDNQIDLDTASVQDRYGQMSNRGVRPVPSRGGASIG